jgi:hypothetical protein
MCYTLSAEKILLNYFASRHQSNKISFEEISSISCKIVKKCNNSILAKTSIDDIEDAVFNRTNVLELDGASVVLKNSNISIFEHIDIVNQAMPEFVKENCIAVFEEYANEER